MVTQLDYNVEYWTEQEKIFLKQLNEQPQQKLMVHRSLAMVYEVMHRFDDCLAHCNIVLQESKNNFDFAEVHCIIGRAFIYRKEYNTALAHFLQAIGFDAEHDAAIMDAGDAYLHLKEFDNAIFWYEKLLPLYEDQESIVYAKIGNTHYEKKDFVKAEEYFQKALSHDKDDPDALSGIGKCFAEKNNFDEAIKYFSLASLAETHAAEMEYYIGLCYQNKEDQYRAMHHYVKALELYPGFPEALNNLGKLYIDFDGDAATAIVHIEKALQQSDDDRLNQMLYLNLARLYAQIADYEKADYYKHKLMEALGFGGYLADGDEGFDFRDDSE